MSQKYVPLTLGTSLSACMIILWWKYSGTDLPLVNSRQSRNVHTYNGREVTGEHENESIENVYGEVLHFFGKQPENDYTDNETTVFIPDTTLPNVEQIMKLNKNHDPLLGILEFQNLIIAKNTDDSRIKSVPNKLNQSNKLKIFFLLHSHNDPGWRETYTEYYERFSSKILSNVLNSLSRDQRLRFVWAEISFLSMFWDRADRYTKRQLKTLLANGQLEIVTGGWVMNDEANTHYFGILQQLIDGHQWLYDNLEYKPKNGWEVDPFGHSPTMPYFLKKMGLENIVINRIHFETKQFLAVNKNLEFYWRQMWDTKNTTDIFTLVLPFHYDEAFCEKHTPCSLKLGINLMKDRGFENEFVELLYTFLYYARFYKSNAILVPVGTDFSFEDSRVLERTINKYSDFIDYVNKNLSERAEAKFATLSEYFEARHALIPREQFKTISGDFFTHSDSTNDYWSGFYTSRPFYKRKDRILLHYLRATEIVFALAWSSKKDPIASKWFISKESGLYGLLRKARRSVSLFQHHDAITGTSKSRVVLDFAIYLNKAVKRLQYIMQQSVHFLLSNYTYEMERNWDYLQMFENYTLTNEYSKILYLKLDDIKTVIIYNSLTWRRKEMVSLVTNSPNAQIFTSNGTELLSQTSPVLTESGDISTSLYTISFIVEIESLSINTYYIQIVKETEENNSNTLAKLTIFTSEWVSKQKYGNIKQLRNLRNFSLYNHHMRANFSKHGLLRSIFFNVNLSIHIDFVVYKNAYSGPYIFLPDGAAQELKVTPSTVRVLTGPLYSQVDISHSLIKHSLRMYHFYSVASLGLEIRNQVDLKHRYCEIAMRISSGIKSGDEFFTDLNGLQMIKRKRLDALGISGNYYPMAAAAYIEDRDFRLTVVSGQPSGFSSLKEGQMEIMLDRRTEADHRRGMPEGITDNVPYTNIINLILERRTPHCDYIPKNNSIGLLSRYGTLLSYSILNPLVRFFSSIKFTQFLPKFSGIHGKVGNDVHLVKFHTLLNDNETKAGVIFHRFAISKCFPAGKQYFISGNGYFYLTSLFAKHFDGEVVRSSLSLLSSGETITKDKWEYISCMDIKAYLLSSL